MNDHQMQLPITVAGLLAASFGLGAITLLVVCFVMHSFAAGFLSTHLAVGSALFRVRSWLCVMNRREQAAFKLGQDSVRELRRV